MNLSQILLRRSSWVAAALFSASAITGCGVPGSGVVGHETRTVTPFTALRVEGEVEATLVVGDLVPLELTGDDNLLPLVETRVEGGVLIVSPSRGVHPDLPLEVRIVAPSVASLTATSSAHIVGRGLEPEKLRIESSGGSAVSLAGVATDSLSVEASGASTVSLSDLSCDEVFLEASGSSRASLAGQGARVVVALSGSSALDGTNFPADILRIDASGASSASVWTAQSVDGSLSGSSSLWVYGNPPSHHVETSGDSDVSFR